MVQLPLLMCLAFGYAEPIPPEADPGQSVLGVPLPGCNKLFARDLPAVLFNSELTLELNEGLSNELKLSLPEEVNVAIQQSKVRKVANRDRHFERQAKQLSVHLTPEKVRIYTPNRPATDLDLYDRRLPADELAVICDGMEESVSEGLTSWTFQGNVQLHASRFMIMCCHEATVTRTDENLLLTVSGGRDYAEDLQGISETEFQPSHSGGSVLMAGERSAKAHTDLSAGSLFSAAKIRIRLNDGKYLVRMEPTAKNVEGD